MNGCLLTAVLMVPNADSPCALIGKTREPVVIDFSPLPCNPRFWSFEITIRSKGGAVTGYPRFRGSDYVATGSFATPATPTDLRDMLMHDLAMEGWCVSPVGKTMLRVSDSKGALVCVEKLSFRDGSTKTSPTVRGGR